MEFKISLKDLDDLSLSFTQYLFLWGLYNSITFSNITINDVIPITLLRDGYIILSGANSYELTDKGREVFEPKATLFNEFIEIFPTRVSAPTGEVRVLSPASPRSNVGKKLKRKWDAITHRDINAEMHLINCLKMEVSLRKGERTLHFMRNAETWLNKCTWEDYEYLLDKPKLEERSYKINEIKL